MKRRTFITTVALTGTAGLTQAMNTEKKPLLHHVFFWLKNLESATDKQELIKGLKNPAAIPSIRQIHIGVLASTEKGRGGYFLGCFLN